MKAPQASGSAAFFSFGKQVYLLPIAKTSSVKMRICGLANTLLHFVSSCREARAARLCEMR
jgi:hypothetical protein